MEEQQSFSLTRTFLEDITATDNWVFLPQSPINIQSQFPSKLKVDKKEWLEKTIADLNITNHDNHSFLKNLLTEEIKTPFKFAQKIEKTLENDEQKADHESKLSPEQKDHLKQIKERLYRLIRLKEKCGNKTAHEKYKQNFPVDPQVASALYSYRFSDDEQKKVIYAISQGDLRTSDFISHSLFYYFICFISLNWGHLFSRGKAFGKEKILKVAEASVNGTSYENPFVEKWIKYGFGFILALIKAFTSGLLAYFFLKLFISTLQISISNFLPFVLSLSLLNTIIIPLAAANGIVSLLSRGNSMIKQFNQPPKKQDLKDTAEKNQRKKSNARWIRKRLIGFIILLACITEIATSWVAFTQVSNKIWLLVPVVLTCAFSFYAFRGTKIEKDLLKFYNNLRKFWKTNKTQFFKTGLKFIFISLVYGLLTWITASSGIAKILALCHIVINANPHYFTNYIIPAICTITTMVVYAFSQIVRTVEKEEPQKKKEENKKPTFPSFIANIVLLIIIYGLLFFNELSCALAAGMLGAKTFLGWVGFSDGVLPLQHLLAWGVTGLFSAAILFYISKSFVWPQVKKAFLAIGNTVKDTVKNIRHRPGLTPAPTVAPVVSAEVGVNGVEDKDPNKGALASVVSVASSTAVPNISTLSPAPAASDNAKKDANPHLDNTHNVEASNPAANNPITSTESSAAYSAFSANNNNTASAGKPNESGPINPIGTPDKDDLPNYSQLNRFASFTFGQDTSITYFSKSSFSRSKGFNSSSKSPVAILYKAN